MRWGLMTGEGPMDGKWYNDSKDGNVYSKDKVEPWFPKSNCFYLTTASFVLLSGSAMAVQLC